MTPPEGAYPRTFAEFIKRFGTEEACLAYVEQIRWPDGFVCPFCGVVAEPWRMGDGKMRCKTCRKRTSVTAGTIFDKTRFPLTMWFHVMWLAAVVVGQPEEVSEPGQQPLDPGNSGPLHRADPGSLTSPVVGQPGESPGGGEQA